VGRKAEPRRVLYLAPWVDIGGSDSSTIDWFRFIDRERFQPSLVTTQPSANARLHEVAPYAEELWELPQLLPGGWFPGFLLSFIHSRRIEILHIMNAQVGFELLPDIAALPDRPRIVVQLHGEEPNHDGYVRYVTTRFGNLVDAFSITTALLNPRLDEYEVPRSKRRLIPIGVDAEHEFSPARIRAVELPDPSTFQLLFPARLTAQKDPLLMVEVAASLRDSGLRFRLHVLGDGDLGEAVKARVAARGLEDEVRLHGARTELAPWYAACDAVLLTSRYETSPTRVAHEAMAIGVPIIVPDAPEFKELVVPGTGVLVAERDNPRAYAEAICALAADSSTRVALGQAGRARVRDGFSAQRMVHDHEDLYDELVAGAPAVAWPSALETPVPGAPLKRRTEATPLVSVIVPCFNHGLYLRDCLESIAKQTYRAIETVIVDDGSTDPETLEALARIERDGTPVLRIPSNRGPSAARNAGIERTSGRYVLPLDADDMLVPTAITDLVEQLGVADPTVGFIYPNLQFFGNRRDYLEMPSFNLYALLRANYCAISSLIDREIFDRGFRFAEDVVFGHEDWDFFLTLAEHRIYGEPARGKTLLVRRHGFSRTDLIEASGVSPALIEARHPSLFARIEQIKAEWNPALSVIALDPPGSEERQLVEAEPGLQTCGDFEVLAPGGRDFGSRARALSDGVRAAKGRFILAAYGSVAELLSDRAVIEKLLRVLTANPRLNGTALADAGAETRPFGLLDDAGARAADLIALCWSASGASAPPESLALPGGAPLEALACWLGATGTVQWRQLTRSTAPSPAAAPDHVGVMLGAPAAARPRDLDRRAALPLLPAPPGVRELEPWAPPQTRLLIRHPQGDRGRFSYSSVEPGAGNGSDGHVLGLLRRYPLDATISLMSQPDGTIWTDADPADPDDRALLGFLEQRRLPLLDALHLGRHPVTGQQVLTAGATDPLVTVLEDTREIGFVVPFPLAPQEPPHIDVSYGLDGLVRSVHLRARAHRYGVGTVPEGEPAGELGALLAFPIGDFEPLWVDDRGRIVTALGPIGLGRPDLRAALRWTVDPFRWRRSGRIGPKLRSSARRALDAARSLVVPAHSPTPPAGQPAGYLLGSPTASTVPLFAAIHAVTGDQLLSTDRAEAIKLGYGEPELLGHLIARAPVTGVLGPIRQAAPWARRFGLV
jgi:glycosyltransferase involved in cell wall biosynthesis